MGVVEYKGSSKSMEGAAMEIYPVGCCYEGCASCCANGMCGKTCGTMYCCAPQFTLTFAEDGGKSGVGKNSNIAGCIPNSPIPCFVCCGVGPLAFQSPFVIVEEDAGNGNKKWVGSGQVCAGGCCPCMNNKGDWGLNSPETDGSSPDKPHVG